MDGPDRPGHPGIGAHEFLYGLDNLVYLKYDTVYGRNEKKVETAGNDLMVAKKRYHYLSEKDPARLPCASHCFPDGPEQSFLFAGIIGCHLRIPFQGQIELKK